MSTETKFIYRITYTKGDSVKYISHLDFLRCVNRSFKRAKIPVKYSQGFNPHILLNIGLPCPVGVSSECELLDIELKWETDTEKIREDLNRAMPEGIQILSVERRTTHPDFYEIEFARYEITFNSDKDFDTESFAKEDSFIIEKKSKRGMKEVNIKDFVKEMSISKTEDGKYRLVCIISAGNKLNLKPDLLLSAIASYHGAIFKDVQTVRQKIFFENQPLQ